MPQRPTPVLGGDGEQEPVRGDGDVRGAGTSVLRPGRPGISAEAAAPAEATALARSRPWWR